MYCPSCRTAIPDDSDECPECGITIGGVGAQMQAQRRVAETPPLLSFSSFGGFIAAAVAIGVTVFAALASFGVMPCLFGGSAIVLPGSEGVDELLKQWRTPVMRNVPQGGRWLLLPVIYAVVMVAVAKTLDVVERFPIVRESTGMHRLLVLLAALCIGFSAIRARTFLFNPLGHYIDWGLNGAALGVGLAVAFVMVLTRRDD